jgi:hypothetical protein
MAAGSASPAAKTWGAGLRLRYTLRAALAAMLLMIIEPAAGSGAGPAAPDHGAWDALLRRHVRDGRVDYAALKAQEEALDAYLAELADVRVADLASSDQFAFYINAYNAWTVKLILGGYPGVRSIKDLGGLFSSPWKRKIARIDGRTISLDEIEHEILRPRFRDPRLHFAVNCAALSCPPLRAEAYRGPVLDRQLDEAARAFINDPERNFLKQDTLFLSAIFDWYGKDFGDDLPAFIARHAEGSLKERLAARRGQLRIAFLAYDWGLNGT